MFEIHRPSVFILGSKSAFCFSLLIPSEFGTLCRSSNLFPSNIGPLDSLVCQEQVSCLVPACPPVKMDWPLRIGMLLLV